MSSLSRENPFTRPSHLFAYSPAAPPHENSCNKNTLKTSNGQIIENPFQKSKFQDLMGGYSGRTSRIKMRDSRSAENMRGSFVSNLPLSRYENRLRLKQLDTELRRREQEQEERYKLQHYGSQALRYSTFSTEYSSYGYLSSRPSSSSKQEELRNNKKVDVNLYSAYPQIQTHSKRVQNGYCSSSREEYYNSPKNEYYLQGHEQNQNNNQNRVEENKMQHRSSTSKFNKGSLQKKDTAHFNNQEDEYYGESFGKPKNLYDSFNNNANIVTKRVSKDSFGKKQEDDYFFDKLAGNQRQKPQNQMYNRDRVMSYGSNYGGNEQNRQMYSSDCVNQQNNSSQSQKGPLNQMKFSSSFDSQRNSGHINRTDHPKFSHFARSSIQPLPYSIVYEGRQYFKIQFTS